jgi:hypothetical protein
MEVTTGWRFVVAELVRAGVEPHLAELAATAAAREQAAGQYQPGGRAIGGCSSSRSGSGVVDRAGPHPGSP